MSPPSALSLLLCLTSLLCLPAPAVAAPRPNSAALRKAFEHSRAAWVEVKVKKRTSPGVIVGAAGQVVTSSRVLGDAPSGRVRLYGTSVTEHEGRVLSSDARLKLAVLQLALPSSGELPEGIRAVAVNLVHPLRRGDWLVGMSPGPKASGPSPNMGRILRSPTDRSPLIETDLRLPPGSPLVDLQGRLVAISVELGPAGTRALPIAALREQLLSSGQGEPDAVAPPTSGRGESIR